MSKSGAQPAPEDALIDEILADARKKAGRTVRRAEQESKDIVQKAQSEAEDVRKSAIDAARQRAERQKTIVLATVDIEAQRIEIDARESVIREAFDAAEKRLAERQGFDYAGVLANLVAAAAEAIGGDRFVVTVAERDRKSVELAALQQTVSRKMGRAVTLDSSSDPTAISGGVIVYSAEGRRMVDNSFESRMARTYDHLRRQVAQFLFELK
ncbi:MAG TPA: V-type ATP synthase subunit E family protein [Planctomycetota bacterium]|nr:V-type ATP synthase subunit E family protein [Planctomycetota bacterium]